MAGSDGGFFFSSHGFDRELWKTIRSVFHCLFCDGVEIYIHGGCLFGEILGGGDMVEVVE